MRVGEVDDGFNCAAGYPVESELLERGVPVFPDPERAARAIKALVKYADLQ